jgi:hypothetical protein
LFHQPALLLTIPQPHPRRVTVRELDASGFEGTTFRAEALKTFKAGLAFQA